MKNTSKRLLSSLVACSLAFTSVAFAAGSMPTDAQNNWASSSIQRWIDAGLVEGDNNGNFNPNNNLTRGELATIFVNMFGLTEKASNNYADLKGSEWYADAILKCTAAGIMNGDGTNCNATKFISRQEAMTMFARALGIKDGNLNALNKFTDGSSTASWAKGALSAMVNMQIISGTTATTLSPNENINRASMMKLLDNAIADYVTEANTVESNSMNKFVIINGDTKARNGNAVEISGYTAGVIVTGSATTNVVLNNVITDVVKVDSGVSLTVNGNSTIGNLELNSGSSVTISNSTSITSATINSTANVENAGTINNLVINAKAKINNTGKLVQVKAAESGIIINGNAPTYLTVPSGVTAPTNTSGQTVTQTGGGSGGGSGSIATTVKNASNATELKEVLANANGTLDVKLTGKAEDYSSLTESDALTFNGIKLTVDFGDIKVSPSTAAGSQGAPTGVLKLVAPNATSIVLNDSGAGKEGAYFNRLTIDAPKADVENYVLFNTVRIEAVSNSTFHANEEADEISIGCGSLELTKNANTTRVNVSDTSGAVTIKGDVDYLYIGSGVNEQVNVDATVQTMQISKKATVTLTEKATVQNATVSSSAGGAVINGSGKVDKVTANTSVVIEGSTSVTTIDVPANSSPAGGNSITITVNGSASVDSVTVPEGSVTNVSIDGNTTGSKPSKPTTIKALTTDNIIPVNIVDKAEEPQQELYTQHKVSVEGNKLNTTGINKVTVTTTDLKKHTNGENKVGYWTGFAVTAPEGAYKMKYAFVTSEVDLNTLSGPSDLEGAVDGKTTGGIAFFTDVDNAKPYCAVQFYDADGNAITSVYKFKMDLSGVTKYQEEPAEPDTTYTITFDANGGSFTEGNTTTLETNTEGKLTALPTVEPTYEGYKFNGWFTMKTDGNEVTTDTVFAENSTVYAHWTKNESTEPEVQTISEVNISSLTAPVTDGKPVGKDDLSFDEGITCESLTWTDSEDRPLSGNFAADTVYKVTIVLKTSSAEQYAFDTSMSKEKIKGIPESAEVEISQPITSDTITITITFEATKAAQGTPSGEEG